MPRYTQLGRRIVVGICVLAAVVGGAPGGLDAAAPPTQRAAAPFATAPCMFDLPLGVIEGQQVVCGYLTTPARHANPDGPTIRLAVAILKSQALNPAPDPLVMLQGGPGGSTIDTYFEILLSDPSFLPNRDIILLEQRGTLYSEPALTCQELDELTIELLDQDISPEEDLQRSAQALQQCHDRLVNEGVDLSAFDSVENAADIEALRVALEYEQINLYGVSYGTLLALHTMRNHPEGLRSVILDAVIPPQTNFLVEAPRSQDRAFTVFFDACASDPQCNDSYPNLEQVFFDLVEQLNETPAQIQMTDPETEIRYDALLDGDSLEESLFQLLYATEIIPALPRLIYAARDGDYTVLSRLIALFVFDRTMSTGMYFSVICAEDADFNLADLQLDGLRPTVATTGRRDVEAILMFCQDWNVDPLGPEIDAPVSSDIPTLLLSGIFDPITPPAFAEGAAATLAQSYNYTFPHSGHSAALSGPCSKQIIRDFLDNPTVEPDASCITGLSGVDFITPANTLRVPSLLPLLNLEGSAANELTLFGASLALLLSIMLIGPVAWLVWMVRRHGGRTVSFVPIRARVLSWLTTLNGIVLLGFALGLFVMIVTSLQTVTTWLLFGAPRSWIGLFTLPLFSLFLTAGMVVGAVLAWRSKFWSVWYRSYYTVLVLADIVCLVLLGLWGMLGAAVFG
ncbi:MAG: alpha/beta hydrolase [Chloroflexales bacterium]|nr:alpha/beta hydrolase [Chloroflexales bacterium]